MLALHATAAQAAPPGMQCDRAASTTEIAICADADLLRLDTQLSAVYGKLAGAQPQQHARLRQAQLAWLKARDQCGSDTHCSSARYEERIAALQAQLRKAIAYKPDSVDLQAIEDLRQAVEAARKTDPVFPLERAIDAIRIKTGMTKFANVNDKKQPYTGAKFPTVRPAGVSRDEWRALQASRIDGGGENGVASYTLMDVDGDGRRDLFIDSYSGGTGLFSFVSALHREGGKFVDELEGDGHLYLINGRGANQAADLIKLRGRVYVAYRNSYYGVDNIYLLRPLTVVGEVPRLAVHYRYRLSVPKVQKDEGKGTVTRLDSALHAAITRALAQVSSEVARDAGLQDKPLCPVPDTVKDDDRDAYYSYGAGHYAYEIVRDMPVWVGGQCFIGRLIDWFGGYSRKDGLFAQLRVRSLKGDDEQTYAVHGLRTAIAGGIKTSVGKVEGDNGM
ncbi:lysozyme inhibitor LprI family protein [Cupriavidus oxalaticus]|nr:lysozyme inhibitor LprI family protein [Cupriavidus oxalaticus]